VVTEAQGWRSCTSRVAAAPATQAYAGAGVGLARPQTSVGVGPLHGVPHGGRTTDLHRLLRLGGGGGGGVRAGGGVGGQVAPPAGREVR